MSIPLASVASWEGLCVLTKILFSDQAYKHHLDNPWLHFVLILLVAAYDTSGNERLSREAIVASLVLPWQHDDKLFP